MTQVFTQSSKITMNLFLETVKIIVKTILLMIMIEFSASKHKDGIYGKTTAKLYEKRNEDS